MAYDEDLAQRIRQLVTDAPGISEKKMFGGLAFLVNGNMAVAASGEGGILLRVDPAESETLVSSSAAQVAVMQGREMAGWLRVAPDAINDKAELEHWVLIGTSYASSLPPKA